MQVPDSTAVVAFGAIGTAIYAAVRTIGKPLIDAYIRNMDRAGEALVESTKAQTEMTAKTMGDISVTLTTLMQEHRTHDALSCAAHAQATEAMKEVVATLRGGNTK